MTEKQSRFLELVDECGLSYDQVEFLVMATKELYKEFEAAEKMKVNDEERNKSSNHSRRERNIFGWKKILRVLVDACLIIIVSGYLAVSGHASNFVNSILHVFQRPEATQVISVQYERTWDLDGYILPSVLPKDYKYEGHSLSSGGTLFVNFKNAQGLEIKYYLYPQKSIASYDNEYTSYRPLHFKRGVAYVSQTSDPSCVLTMYLLLDDTYYVQMDFDENFTDLELIAIADGLQISEKRSE